MTSHDQPSRPLRHHLRWLVAIAASLALIGGVLTAPASAAPADPANPRAKVATELARQVTQDAGDRIQALLMLPNPASYQGNPETAVQRIRDHARDRQNRVELALERHAETRGDVRIVNRFWITNALLIEFTASNKRLSALAATPGVERVLPNFTMSLPDREPDAAGDPSAAIVDGRITWGLDRIRAERVWQELGLDGSGVRVVTLDTGVAINHPDLVGKMATDNPADPTYPGGWMEFNASGGLVSSQPRDSSTHGTHVAGTIHGGNASGVHIGGAPGAEMAHGLVIPGGSGTFAQVVAGMQWAIAPTDAAGNPAGRPADVVNMSLGAAAYTQEMIAPTRAIVAAGAFPAFAIGNAGLTGCGVGSSSPGNVYEAVGVGATDINDNVASFSCGNVVNKSSWANPPADWPDSYVTPDLSAPGAQVWSAGPDGGYRYASGTSMATPHTSAVAALIRQGAPELDVEQMRTAMVETSFWEDRYATSRPDTRYGHGRIDAYAAVSRVALDSGITGRVTATGSGNPVAGAKVTVTPGGANVTTDANGEYTLRLTPGSYELTVSAFAHEPATITGITVSEDTFTRTDVSLTALPIGTISGSVTLAESGHGIPGVTVSVLGLPVERSARTDVNGAYRIEVPAGSYRVAASHPGFSAPQPVEVVVPAAGSATANFAFNPPPQEVAIVGDYANSFIDNFFAPRGIKTVVYDWPQLAEAAKHPLAVLSYGLASDYNAANFQAFLDATDASGTGVIFTDHAFGPASGIRQLAQHTGQPESTGSLSSGTGIAESFYEVTAAHPLFDGYSVGDRIPLDNSTQAKWIAWFDGYAGEGRATIANMGRTDGIRGGGIGVDQRANNRHVLMSSHGASATRGAVDWTPEAAQLFLNAVNWAARPVNAGQPYFAVHNLTVSPEEVKTNQPVTVRVEVKNVGASTGTYNAVLRVNGQTAATTPVNLASGVNRALSWQVSRAELGNYTVSVEYLSDSFRVRPPRVDLTVRTVDAPDADPAPLAGATVELIRNGQILPMGATADDGTLTFEAPAPVGRYTLVVRHDGGDGAPAYLLHKSITVFDDDRVVFAPRVLAGGARMLAAVEQDFVTRVKLTTDQVDPAHRSRLYLRPAATAPWAYSYQPGTLVASLDNYQAVAVHQAPRLERDWWLVSKTIQGLRWIDPFDQTFRFGGRASVQLGAERTATGMTVDWDVTDAHGHPFATVLATDLRPFADLPAVMELDKVAGAVRALAPNEERPILRLFAPSGTPLRAGYLNWNAQSYPVPISDPQPGAYRLEMELNTGFFSGTVSAQTTVVLVDPPVGIDPVRAVGYGPLAA